MERESQHRRVLSEVRPTKSTSRVKGQVDSTGRGGHRVPGSLHPGGTAPKHTEIPTLPSGRLELVELDEAPHTTDNLQGKFGKCWIQRVSYVSENLNAPVSVRKFEMMSGSTR